MTVGWNGSRENIKLGWRARFKHGRPLAYQSWASMIQRCTNAKNPDYFRYGGRGILVCDRWLSFENFHADMGERPKNSSLDRIDNEGNYEPGNCRWATASQQLLNTRRNRIIAFREDRLPLSEMAKKYGMTSVALATRLKRGWSIESALLRPIQTRRTTSS